jgi:hypothetical protein
VTAIQQDYMSDKLKLFFLGIFLFLGALVILALRESPPPGLNQYGSPFNEGKTGAAVVQPAPGFGSHESGGSQGVTQME